MKAYTATGVPAWEAKGLIRHTPPESVPITFRLSSLGARFGAQMLDLTFTYGGVILLLVAVAWLGIFSWNGLFTFYALITFFMRVPYYILSEMVWNGRTLGKRILGIRVISLDGRRLTPHQIVARNLMKEVEVFLPMGAIMGGADLGWIPGLILAGWMLATVLVPVFNKKKQRLGDMVAGTIVVDNPKPQLLPDLTVQAAALGYESGPGIWASTAATNCRCWRRSCACRRRRPRRAGMSPRSPRPSAAASAMTRSCRKAANGIS